MDGNFLVFLTGGDFLVSVGGIDFLVLLAGVGTMGRESLLQFSSVILISCFSFPFLDSLLIHSDCLFLCIGLLRVVSIIEISSAMLCRPRVLPVTGFRILSLLGHRD